VGDKPYVGEKENMPEGIKRVLERIVRPLRPGWPSKEALKPIQIRLKKA